MDLIIGDDVILMHAICYCGFLTTQALADSEPSLDNACVCILRSFAFSRHTTCCETVVFRHFTL